jgi:hypothetical protein
LKLLLQSVTVVVVVVVVVAVAVVVVVVVSVGSVVSWTVAGAGCLGQRLRLLLWQQQQRLQLEFGRQWRRRSAPNVETPWGAPAHHSVSALISHQLLLLLLLLLPFLLLQLLVLLQLQLPLPMPSSPPPRRPPLEPQLPYLSQGIQPLQLQLAHVLRWGHSH